MLTTTAALTTTTVLQRIVEECHHPGKALEAGPDQRMEIRDLVF
jgi:hypothetical protein